MAIGMRHGWQRAVTAGSVGLIAVLLCACVEVNQKSVIKSDFTGITTLRIGISRLLIETFKDAGANLSGTPTPSTANSANSANSDLFADTKKQVADMGGTATDYQNDNFVGIDATLPFTSLDQMVSQINTLLGSSSGSGGPSSSPGGSPSSGGGPGALVTITTSPTASGGIRIDGDVDPLSEFNDPTGTSPASGIDTATLLGAGGTVQLSFTMPGAIRSTDALATTSGTTVSWSFNVGDKRATIFVEADKG